MNGPAVLKRGVRFRMICEDGREIHDNSPIDVVIVNFNSTDYLLKCLKSIHEAPNGIPLHVYVRDNASRDGTERVTCQYPGIEMERAPRNEGYSRSVNALLSKCRSPLVVLLNPDTVLRPNFFDGIQAYMREHREVGILGPRIMNPDGTIQGSARTFPTPLTALFGRNSFLTRWFPNNPVSRKNMIHDRCDGKTPMPVDWVSGACMVVRKEVLDEVGFLDERFFMYWEDVDLCGRMWQAGWKVVYFPLVSVIHHVGGSSEKRLFPSIYEFHKSCWRLVAKNAKIPKFILGPVILPVLAARLGVVSLYHMIRRRKLNPVKR